MCVKSYISGFLMITDMFEKIHIEELIRRINVDVELTFQLVANIWSKYFDTLTSSWVRD